MTILVKFSARKYYFRFVELASNYFTTIENHYIKGTLHSKKIYRRTIFPFSKWPSSGKKTSLPSILETIKERTCSRPSILSFVRAERGESEREEESRASYDPVHRKFRPLAPLRLRPIPSYLLLIGYVSLELSYFQDVRHIFLRSLRMSRVADL